MFWAAVDFLKLYDRLSDLLWRRNSGLCDHLQAMLMRLMQRARKLARPRCNQPSPASHTRPSRPDPDPP